MATMVALLLLSAAAPPDTLGREVVIWCVPPYHIAQRPEDEVRCQSFFDAYASAHCPQTTGAKAREVFLAYARKNGARMENQAGAEVARALREAKLC